MEDEAKAGIIAVGGAVRTLTPEQRALWVEALRPVCKQVEDDIGADLIQAAASFNPTN